MFKEEYKRDNEMINPSKEFLDKLKTEMKKEEEKQKKYKSFNARKIAAVAAILAVAIVSADSYNKIYNSNKNNVVQQAEVSKESDKKGSDNEVNESQQQGNLFNNSRWYDSGMSSEEIYKTFIKRISSKDDLKELSASSTEDFTNSKPMDKASIDEVIVLLNNGRLIEDNIGSMENPKYYMASFNNGDIIKFIVYDNKYFECREFKGRFSVGS